MAFKLSASATRGAALKQSASAPCSGTLKLTASATGGAKHQNDVVALLYHNDQLISGADDGKIKIWTPDLELVSEIDAHPVNVYSVAILGDTLYSSSNDGTIKAWDMNTWDYKATIYEDSKHDIIRLCADSGKLYGGNEQGDVHVFEDDVKLATYSLQEDIADFTVLGNLVFNARNTDVSVTEMRPGPRFGYMSRGCLIGRFPIKLVGDKVCFLSRSGKNIYVHATTTELKFQRVTEIKAHDMTICAMCGLAGTDNVLLSAGYDRVLRAWDLNTYKKLAQLDLGVCINELCSGAPGQIYVSSSDGYIARIEVKL